MENLDEDYGLLFTDGLLGKKEKEKVLTKTDKFLLCLGVGVVCLFAIPMIIGVKNRNEKPKPKNVIIKKGLFWDTRYEVY